jgi:menaquinone-dependent protoporphyrinogen oxidase
MKTAIIFRSKHGTTKLVAGMIASKLDGEVEFFDLSKIKEPYLNGTDRVIIGGSIHEGRIQKEVRQYCERNINYLKTKETGLFICCMETDPLKRQKQFDDAFPELLKLRARAKAILGGEFIFEKMNFFERFAVKRIAKIDHTIHNIDVAEIDHFAEEMNVPVIHDYAMA